MAQEELDYAEEVKNLSAVISALKQATKTFIKMDLHARDNGEVELNKEWIKKHAVKSYIVKHELEMLFDKIYPAIADELTYQARKQWSEEKERERKQLNKLADPLSED